MYKIEDYWKFDTEKLIKDYPKNKEKLAELRESIEEITEVKTINYGSPPGTPGRGDSVPTIVADKQRKQNELNDVQILVYLYEKAQSRLTDTEKTIIHYWFHEPGMLSSRIRFLEKKLNYSNQELYRRRRLAIDKMHDRIMKIIR